MCFLSFSFLTICITAALISVVLFPESGSLRCIQPDQTWWFKGFQHLRCWFPSVHRYPSQAKVNLVAEVLLCFLTCRKHVKLNCPISPKKTKKQNLKTECLAKLFTKVDYNLLQRINITWKKNNIFSYVYFFLLFKFNMGGMHWHSSQWRSDELLSVLNTYIPKMLPFFLYQKSQT